MTKKHYIAIAKRIRFDIESAARVQDGTHLRAAAMYAAHLFANVAAADNPRFDRARFLAACGL